MEKKLDLIDQIYGEIWRNLFKLLELLCSSYNKISSRPILLIN